MLEILYFRPLVLLGLDPSKFRNRDFHTPLPLRTQTKPDNNISYRSYIGMCDRYRTAVHRAVWQPRTAVLAMLSLKRHENTKIWSTYKNSSFRRPDRRFEDIEVNLLWPSFLMKNNKNNNHHHHKNNKFNRHTGIVWTRFYASSQVAATLLTRDHKTQHKLFSLFHTCDLHDTIVIVGELWQSVNQYDVKVSFQGELRGCVEIFETRKARFRSALSVRHFKNNLMI